MKIGEVSLSKLFRRVNCELGDSESVGISRVCIVGCDLGEVAVEDTFAIELFLLTGEFHLELPLPLLEFGGLGRGLE